MKKSLLILSIVLLSNLFSANLNALVRNGADRLDLLLDKLAGKKVALVANQTSILNNGTHLLDTLLSEKVEITKIYVPEHGFRGNADAGETVLNGADKKTGVLIESLYGNNKKPKKTSLAGTDVVVFDLQDVGTRFYTYISTMHYIMEACAENGIECIILDRPNPNDYIDGPVLKTKFKSFVGMHPIPVLHGLTVGELAIMINGEGWLPNAAQCQLTVVPVEGWQHGDSYSLPVKPSPNLPNDQAVKLYPSLCFFEATGVSVGRGTEAPFQMIGYPDSAFGEFTFTPVSLPGSAKNPPQKDKLCYGHDLRTINFAGGLSLEFILPFYQKSNQGAAFFTSPSFMDKLAGTDQLRLQVIGGKTEDKIRATWQPDLAKYKTMRAKYLLYPESK